jgi:hypothetical protein
LQHAPGFQAQHALRDDQIDAGGIESSRSHEATRFLDVLPIERKYLLAAHAVEGNPRIAMMHRVVNLVTLMNNE